MTEKYHPPLHINWNRPVANEELFNLSRDIPDARNRLDKAAGRLSETGTPDSIAYDDLDRDTVVGVPIDWDMIERLDFILNRGEQHLAKQGIVFEPNYPPKDETH